jgi:hypothetical protein
VPISLVCTPIFLPCASEAPCSPVFLPLCSPRALLPDAPPCRTHRRSVRARSAPPMPRLPALGVLLPIPYSPTTVVLSTPARLHGRVRQVRQRSVTVRLLSLLRASMHARRVPFVVPLHPLLSLVTTPDVLRPASFPSLLV